MAEMPTGTRPGNPDSPRKGSARVSTVIAFVCAVLAIFLSPLIFGVLGLILGIVGARLGDRPLGWYAAAAAVVGAVIGFLINVAVLNN